MTKLCPRGKAAAKRKFKVYPSAYANAYASKICAGKIKDPSGVKRKDFRGPKPSKAMGGRIYKADGGNVKKRPTAFRKDRKFFKKISKALKKTPLISPIEIGEKLAERANKKKTPRLEQGGKVRDFKKSSPKKPRPAPRPRGNPPVIGQPSPRPVPKRKQAPKPIERTPKRLMRESKPLHLLARPKMMGGGMMKMPRAMYKKGGIAKGCGAVMSDRRKVTKVF